MLKKIKPKVLSFALRKGGVCRTTLVLNVSYALALKGFRVLMIDLDSQHNLTDICVDLKENDPTIYDALAEQQELGYAICPTSHENLFIVPGDKDMSSLDFALAEVPVDHRFKLLRTWLESSKATNNFDIITIDMGPSMNGAMLNALIASTHFMAPVKAQSDGLDGLKLLFDEMDEVVYKENPGIKFIGAALLDFDIRKDICKLVDKTLKKRLGKEYFSSKVRTNTNFEKARPHRQSIFEYESAGSANKNKRKGCDEIMAVAREVIKRCELNKRAIKKETKTERLVANG